MKVRGYRKIFVTVLILVVIGSWAGCIILQTNFNFWPFSWNPMYRYRIRKREFSRVRMFGVTGGNPSQEFPILRQYLSPVSEQEFVRTIKIFSKLEPTVRQRHLDEAISDCLARYEAKRLKKRHAGHQLSGIRLYKVTWQLDHWARNLNSPSKKDLIYEHVLTSH